MDIYTSENKDNMAEKEKQIVRKMQLKTKFYDKYEKASLPVRGLFIKLITMADEKCIKSQASDTPDYRLVEKNGRINFCLITLTVNYLNLHIHRNTYSLHSDILNFSPVSEGRYSGTDWIAVKVKNETELEEAFRLIYAIYHES